MTELLIKFNSTQTALQTIIFKIRGVDATYLCPLKTADTGIPAAKNPTQLTNLLQLLPLYRQGNIIIVCLYAADPPNTLIEFPKQP